MITPKQKYGNAVRSAQQRGIEWHFTFETWMAWWGDDFHLRGPLSNDLCMARHGDQGPYHPDNVRKATNSENVREMRFRVGGNGGRISFAHSEETKERMSEQRKGKISWNKGLAGTGRCKAWNKGMSKEHQLAYIASKGV